MQCNVASVSVKLALKLIQQSVLLLIISSSALFAPNVFAIDPPSNIRIEGGDLLWDEVPGANEYHVYYFAGPVPSDSNTGNFVRNTSGTFEPLVSFNDPFGYYTVVSTVFDIQGNLIDFSGVTEGAIVPYLDPNDNSTPVTNPQPIISSLSVLIAQEQCTNVVASDGCIASCPATHQVTGGACRADAGVTVHSRATPIGHQCIAQQDVAVIEADAYCVSVVTE